MQVSRREKTICNKFLEEISACNKFPNKIKIGGVP